MIAHLRGKLIYKQPGPAIVLVSGGFLAFPPLHGVVRRGTLRRLSARENASLGLEDFSAVRGRDSNEA